MYSRSLYEVDLHVHTTASDGIYPSVEVMNIASKCGLKAVGITDHDSINGIDDAIEISKYVGVTCVPGVEITSNYEGNELHILGLFIDWHNTNLCEKLEEIQTVRSYRGEQMVELLIEMGVPISIDSVKNIANGESIGRMHIAKALVKANIISNYKEAFTKQYIGNNGRAYVDRKLVLPNEAIELILNAGGIPILAHPGITRSNESFGERLILKLSQWGLRGIEVSYPDHSKEQFLSYSKIADDNGLLKTGGSDFHGYDGMSYIGEAGISYDEFMRLRDETCIS